MPFYKISLSLKKNDQLVAGQMISVIREFKDSDLDRVWHMLHLKCEEKWGRKLISFDCVTISKRSPHYLKWIKDRQQKKFNKYDDILSPVYFPKADTSKPKNSSSQSINGKYRNQRE